MERINAAMETIEKLYEEYLLSADDTVNLRPYDESLLEVHNLLEAIRDCMKAKQEENNV